MIYQDSEIINLHAAGGIVESGILDGLKFLDAHFFLYADRALGDKLLK